MTNTKPISEFTVHSMAWDIRQGVLTLAHIKLMDLDEQSKSFLVARAISPLRYISLLMDVHETLERDVALILIARSPVSIKLWRDVKAILNAEDLARSMVEYESPIRDTAMADSVIRDLMSKS